MSAAHSLCPILSPAPFGGGHAVTVNGTIETERLLLRPFVPNDQDDLWRLHAEESFWWYPLRGP